MKPEKRVMKKNKSSICEEIKPEHSAEAIQYRSLDREGWAV
jgi:hypothetical protein